MKGLTEKESILQISAELLKTSKKYADKGYVTICNGILSVLEDYLSKEMNIKK